MPVAIGIGIGHALGQGVNPYAGLTLLSSFPSDITNAYWTKNASTVTTGRTDPRGGTTAEAAFETVANSGHGIAKEGVLNLVSGTTYIIEGVVKSIGARQFNLAYYNAGFTFGHDNFFDIVNGALGGVVLDDGAALSINEIATIVAVGGGYYRCRIQFTATANVTGGNFYWSAADSLSTVSYAGDITKGVDFDSLGLYRVG